MPARVCVPASRNVFVYSSSIGSATQTSTPPTASERPATPRNCTTPANRMGMPSSFSTVFRTQLSPPCESTLFIFTSYSS
jgi:hypothetical protein